MRMPEGIFFIIQATSDESWTDMSQRILNVLMPDTVIPIHRHNESSETVIICRGKVREEFYDDNGQKIAEFVLDEKLVELLRICNYQSMSK